MIHNEISEEFVVTGGWIHLQHTAIAVALANWNFSLFFTLKTIKNTNGQMKILALASHIIM